MYGILNEVLDIRYLDKNNEYQNKQITINTKTILNVTNLNVLIKNVESYLTIIYDNNSYLDELYRVNYDHIIKSNLNADCILKYATKYFYLDYY